MQQQNWDPPTQNQQGDAKSMSKETMGYKHVICANIQPPLGSHWPHGGGAVRRLLPGAPLSHSPKLTRLAGDFRVEA